jgi:hypothetical protein
MEPESSATVGMPMRLQAGAALRALSANVGMVSSGSSSRKIRETQKAEQQPCCPPDLAQLPDSCGYDREPNVTARSVLQNVPTISRCLSIRSLMPLSACDSASGCNDRKRRFGGPAVR